MIVNSNLVKELRKYCRGKYVLIVKDLNNIKIETGANYRIQIKDKFDL